MDKEKVNIWSIVLNFILGALLVVSLIFLFRSCNASPEVIEIIKNDTIVVTKNDTIFKERIKYVTTIDTTIIFQRDSIIDTIYVTLPDEHKEATFKKSQDSIDLEAKIHYHGYKAEIDTVEFAYQLHYTQEIPKPKPKKFGWCITFGPSLSYDITLDTQNKTWSHGPSAGFSVVIGPSYIIK